MMQLQEKGPYKMRTIARLTDFSPALLRAWERRHDLLRPLRGSGGHRLYTEDDLRVLLHVRDLIRQGRSIGEIARVGRDVLLRESETTERLASPLPAHPVESIRPEIADELGRLRERAVDAALKMDSFALNRVLDEAFVKVSPELVIEELIQPSARQIGELWMTGKCSVANEHVASGVFVHRLRKLLESAEPIGGPRLSALVACFPDEYHQLGALTISYHLARRGVRVNFLGAALPFQDLEGACQVLEPSAVLLSVTRPEIYRLHRKDLFRAITRMKVSPVYIGGLGAPAKDPELAQAGVKIIGGGIDGPALLDEIREEMRQRSSSSFLRW